MQKTKAWFRLQMLLERVCLWHMKCDRIDSAIIPAFSNGNTLLANLLCNIWFGIFVCISVLKPYQSILSIFPAFKYSICKENLNPHWWKVGTRDTYQLLLLSTALVLLHIILHSVWSRLIRKVSFVSVPLFVNMIPMSTCMQMGVDTCFSFPLFPYNV